jgi:hypothetical protein
LLGGSPKSVAIEMPNARCLVWADLRMEERAFAGLPTPCGLFLACYEKPAGAELSATADVLALLKPHGVETI